jgi:hypothetical protein
MILNCYGFTLILIAGLWLAAKLIYWLWPDWWRRNIVDEDTDFIEYPLQLNLRKN